METALEKRVERKFVIKNRLGLHARAAAMLVQLANAFESDIFIVKDGPEVNGKSIMGVLILAAGMGSEIAVRAVGNDAESAMEAIAGLIERGFDEE